MKDELIRRIVKLFKGKELLKIGDRSYINAFKYPLSRFDMKEIALNGGDPGVERVLHRFTLVPPSSLVFKWGDGLVYDKRWWGKVYGGIPDASKVIQTAVDTVNAAGGGKVLIKLGTYELSTPIDVKTNVIIEGEGLATIMLPGDFPAFRFNDTVRGMLRLLYIKGLNDPSKTNNVGVYLTGTLHHCVENRIEDVFVEKCYDGVKIDFGDVCWLNRVYCWDNKHAGLYLNGDSTWRVNWIDITGSYFGNNVDFDVLAGYAMGCKFTDVVCEGGGITKYGVFMDYNYLNWFVNLDVENCALTGVVSQRSIDAGGVGNKFLGGWSSGNGANGVYFYRERWGSLIDFAIGENQEHGVLIDACEKLILLGVKAYNNGKKSAGVYHGVVLHDTQGTLIRDCHVWDFQATKTQGYGVFEYGASDYNIVALNDVRDNLTGGVVKGGANTVVKGNLGHVTENCGSATIPAGSTYVDVPHGLAVTPDANRIKVMPKDNLGGRSFWVDNVTATSFRINISSTDTVNHVFGWSYE